MEIILRLKKALAKIGLITNRKTLNKEEKPMKEVTKRKLQNTLAEP